MFPWWWNVCGSRGIWILFTWQIWITGEKGCDDILYKYCTGEDDPLPWGHCSSAFCLLIPLVISERRKKKKRLSRPSFFGTATISYFLNHNTEVWQVRSTKVISSLLFIIIIPSLFDHTTHPVSTVLHLIFNSLNRCLCVKSIKRCLVLQYLHFKKRKITIWAVWEVLCFPQKSVRETLLTVVLAGKSLFLEVSQR